MRVVTPDDWRLWRELRLLALEESASAFGSQLADWQGDGDREERWRARLSLPGSYNLLAITAGRPVGMASGIPNENKRTIELISMYVAPSGRGQGVGDRLVQAVAQWAVQAGARRLRLAVVAGNSHAEALYRRQGFRATGELGEVLPDGVRREHIMAVELDGEGTGHG
ncbi:GNAT family N-acetyltransferase [Actinoplanes sp. NPDC051859]|uniref:GNAT family N-acetyltransferase n=1 Tax=Actinoplanes sp. NPDC051859 TaxID=3363909 RepID=UPI0037B0B641